MNVPSTEGAAAPAVTEAIEGAELPATETAADEGQEPAEGQETQAEPKREALPKWAENKLSKLERRVGSLTAREKAAVRQSQEYQQKLAAYESGRTDTKPKPPSSGPSADQFDNLDDYVNAATTKAAETVMQQAEQKRQDELRQQNFSKWKEEREAHLNNDTDEAAKAFPDFDEVFADAEADLPSLKPHVFRAFYEADKGAHALYQLHKEGKLLDLNGMSLSQASAAIARAEDRALAAAKAKVKAITQAPAPMAPNKGTRPVAQSNIPLNTNDPKKILDWARGKR